MQTFANHHHSFFPTKIPFHAPLHRAIGVKQNFPSTHHETDTYTSLDKQYKMMKLIHAFYLYANEAIDSFAELSEVLSVPSIERIGRAKYVEEKDVHLLDEAQSSLVSELKALARGGREDV